MPDLLACVERHLLERSTRRVEGESTSATQSDAAVGNASLEIRVRKALRSPPSEIGNLDVCSEVKLWLVQDDPLAATGSSGVAGVEVNVRLGTERRGGACACAVHEQPAAVRLPATGPKSGMLRPMLARTRALVFAAVSLSLFVAGCGKKDGAGGGPSASTSASPAKADEGLLGSLKKAVSSDVTIAKVPRKAGDKRKVAHTSSFRIDLKIGAKSESFGETEDYLYTEEVLGVTGDAVTKLKVSYGQHKRATQNGAKPPVEGKDILAGKSFLLESVNGKTVITKDDGKPADAASKAAVQRDYKRFGQADGVGAAVPTRALKPGEEVKELGDALGKRMGESMDGDKQGMTAEAPKVVLEKQEGDNAHFTISLTLRIAKGPLKGTIPLTGAMDIRTKDGAPSKLEVKGPIQLEADEKAKKMGVSGGGEVKTSDVYTYL